MLEYPFQLNHETFTFPYFKKRTTLSSSFDFSMCILLQCVHTAVISSLYAVDHALGLDEPPNIQTSLSLAHDHGQAPKPASHVLLICIASHITRDSKLYK